MNVLTMTFLLFISVCSWGARQLPRIGPRLINATCLHSTTSTLQTYATPFNKPTNLPILDSLTRKESRNVHSRPNEHPNNQTLSNLHHNLLNRPVNPRSQTPRGHPHLAALLELRAILARYYMAGCWVCQFHRDAFCLRVDLSFTGY